ncbi:MAG TPA: type I secretion system permease/ATPase [Herbaspirillum sp.]|nr:type I secretion system permease/ATPase [Herbaspirillum sp.]
MSSTNAIVYTPWLDAMRQIAVHHGLSVSQENLTRMMAWERGVALESAMVRIARRLGLEGRVLQDVPCERINQALLPALVELKDKGVAVLYQVRDGMASVCFAGTDGLRTEMPLADLMEQAGGRILLLTLQERLRDARVDEFLQPYQRSWFWSAVCRDWGRYSEIVLASLFGNLLALATVLFSMQVYDRVIPAQSHNTLWVLAIGVTTAIVIEFIIRNMRVRVADLAGKRMDLAMSGLFFARAMDMRSDVRPRSTGSFISQLRELEQVRELMTSTTVTAIADMPFVLMFMGVIAYIGGPIAWVVAAALPLIVIAGLLLQVPLARLAREGLRESSLRSAILVESIEGVEDIKMMQAEQRFQKQWDVYTAKGAGISMKQRMWGALLTNWNQSLQQLVFTGVLVVGVYQVLAEQATTGTLVACALLSGRAIGPLAQLAMVFTRWQHAKVAREGLNNILTKETDHGPENQRLHRPALRGEYSFRNVSYAYSAKDRPVLSLDDLQIAAGEKVAVLGRMGAGKSTLLRLMSGLSRPQSGELLIDEVPLAAVDAADLRRDVGLLTQDARLFHGTVRDNLLMGAPEAGEEAVMEALQVSGALRFVQQQQHGLDTMISEGGKGLSGGQRQTLLLARLLVRRPRLLLLDEPTASMDDATERAVIADLKGWIKDRTLVLVTHRLPILALVDRVIVIEDGKISIDGPRDEVMRKLGHPAPVTLN